MSSTRVLEFPSSRCVFKFSDLSASCSSSPRILREFCASSSSFPRFPRVLREIRASFQSYARVMCEFRASSPSYPRSPRVPREFSELCAFSASSPRPHRDFELSSFSVSFSRVQRWFCASSPSYPRVLSEFSISASSSLRVLLEFCEFSGLVSSS